MRLLLVEDSERLQRSIGTGLRKSGYAVDVSGDGLEGLWYARTYDYDVIILDLMLPGLDGMSVLRKLRDEGKSTHVLILTARDAVKDRVDGLRAGGDDYLVKPFAFDELLARVEALARRQHHAKNPALVIDDLKLDTSAKTVECRGVPVRLAPREYALLEYLALRQGSVVSREEIEAHLYDGGAEMMSNVVDSTVCAVRRKIDPHDSTSLIQTRRGLGYQLLPRRPASS